MRAGVRGSLRANAVPAMLLCLFLTFFPSCRLSGGDAAVSSAGSEGRVFALLAMRETLFKQSTADSSTIRDKSTLCRVAKGWTGVAHTMVDAGAQHVKVTFQSLAVPGCKFTSGFIYKPHFEITPTTLAMIATPTPTPSPAAVLTSIPVFSPSPVPTGEPSPAPTAVTVPSVAPTSGTGSAAATTMDGLTCPATQPSDGANTGTTGGSGVTVVGGGVSVVSPGGGETRLGAGDSVVINRDGTRSVTRGTTVRLPMKCSASDEVLECPEQCGQNVCAFVCSFPEYG